MALHESEVKSLCEATSESERMRLLAHELHDAISKGPQRGNIIPIRATIETAPQQIRIRSKG